MNSITTYFITIALVKKHKMMYNIFVIVMNKKEKGLKIDIAIRIISIILLICWMILVFWFSSQGGSESSNTSGNTIRSIVTFFNNNINPNDLELIVDTFQPIARKVAHITLYTIGGFLIYNVTYRLKFTLKNNIGISILLGILYAISDEIHQYFIVGRSSSVYDVFIDTTGIILGILIYIILLKIITKIFVKKVIEKLCKVWYNYHT